MPLDRAFQDRQGHLVPSVVLRLGGSMAGRMEMACPGGSDFGLLCVPSCLCGPTLFVFYVGIANFLLDLKFVTLNITYSLVAWLNC